MLREESNLLDRNRITDIVGGRTIRVGIITISTFANIIFELVADKNLKQQDAGDEAQDQAKV